MPELKQEQGIHILIKNELILTKYDLFRFFYVVKVN